MGKFIQDFADGSESYLDGNAKTIYFSAFEMNFLDRFKKMLLEDQLTILEISAIGLVGFFDAQKYQTELELKSLFKKDYRWRETGEDYSFEDESINFDLFGVELTKKQIVGKLKRKSFPLSELLKMKCFFESTDELFEIET